MDTQRIQQYVLPVGFTFILSLMILMTFISTKQIKDSTQIMAKAVIQQNSINEQLVNMSNLAIERSIVLVEMLHSDDPFHIDELGLKMSELATRFTLIRQQLLTYELDPIITQLLEKQAEIAKVNVPNQRQVIEYLIEGHRDEGFSLFAKSAYPMQREALHLLLKMETEQGRLVQEEFAEVLKVSKKAITTVLAFNIFSIILSLMLAGWLIRKQSRSDNQLTKMARTDILTKLPNRSHLINQVNTQIKRNPDRIFAIIFLDIDYFKSINDNYGHEAGDEILIRFSRKIKDYIGPKDIIARFGGDEFVLLVRSIHSKEEARALVETLSRQLDTSFQIQGQEIFTASSIGVSLYPQDGNNTKELLKHADIAMYNTKEAGRNSFQFFSQENCDKMEREHALSHSLHSLLKNEHSEDQLFLKYQPLLNIGSGNITDCEALIRWKTADGREYSPHEFIPLAEKSNLIHEVNLFVIDQACQQLAEWQESGDTHIRININLSGNRQTFSLLIEHLNHNIDSMNLDPGRLGIELTERTIHEIPEDTFDRLDQLRQRGLRISIDDFGTGYSSLVYLKSLPISTLKIDKAFIFNLPEDKDDQAVIKAIITLAHSLNLDVVAEGVETMEQYRFLKKISCNIAQGFFLYHPLSAGKISELDLDRPGTFGGAVPKSISEIAVNL